MNLGAEVGNGVLTFLAGYGAGLSDRLFSENAKRFGGEERTKRKFDRVQALSYLAECGDIVPENAGEYNRNMLLARQYFESRGLQRSRKAAGQIVQKVANYANSPELINNLRAGSTLALAAGIEFLIDGMVLAVQTLSGYGHVGKAFGRSVYQIPCLFAGMEAAKATLWVKDLARSREERDIDRLGKELTRDGKLYHLVMDYSPTARLSVDSRVVDKSLEQGQPQDSNDSITALGEKVATRIANGAGSVSDNIGAGLTVIKQRLENRRKTRKEADERKQRELTKDFDNL